MLWSRVPMLRCYVSAHPQYVIAQNFLEDFGSVPWQRYEDLLSSRKDCKTFGVCKSLRNKSQSRHKTKALKSPSKPPVSVYVAESKALNRQTIHRFTKETNIFHRFPFRNATRSEINVTQLNNILNDNEKIWDCAIFSDDKDVGNQHPTAAGATLQRD